MEEVEVILVQSMDNTEDNRQVIVTFKIDKKLLKAIDKCKEKEGLRHRSELIRRALKMYLEVSGCELP